MTKTNNIAVDDDGQVVVFQRPRLINGWYSKDEFEDVFYKDKVLNGKHMFQRIRKPTNMK